MAQQPAGPQQHWWQDGWACPDRVPEGGRPSLTAAAWRDNNQQGSNKSPHLLEQRPHAAAHFGQPLPQLRNQLQAVVGVEYSCVRGWQVCSREGQICSHVACRSAASKQPEAAVTAAGAGSNTTMCPPDRQHQCMRPQRCSLRTHPKNTNKQSLGPPAAAWARPAAIDHKGRSASTLFKHLGDQSPLHPPAAAQARPAAPPPAAARA